MKTQVHFVTELYPDAEGDKLIPHPQAYNHWGMAYKRVKEIIKELSEGMEHPPKYGECVSWEKPGHRIFIMNKESRKHIPEFELKCKWPEFHIISYEVNIVLHT